MFTYVKLSFRKEFCLDTDNLACTSHSYPVLLESLRLSGHLVTTDTFNLQIKKYFDLGDTDQMWKRQG